MPHDLSDSSPKTAAKERSAHAGDASRAPDPSAEADYDEIAHIADPAANPGQDQFSAALALFYADPRSDSSEPNNYGSRFGVQDNSKSHCTSRRVESHVPHSSE